MAEPDDIEAQVPDRMFFRIGEAAELVGVEPHVLRYWETEFKMRPPRSDSGQRMYRRKDVTRFLRIKKLLHDEGFTIAGARKALADAGSLDVPATGGSADSDRVREARTRLVALRKRVQDTRARLAKWSPPK